jgi:uncharacterized membrane protein YedE/YeeE
VAPVPRKRPWHFWIWPVVIGGLLFGLTVVSDALIGGGLRWIALVVFIVFVFPVLMRWLFRVYGMEDQIRRSWPWQR